jgi:phosphate uptake regulator/aminoglycoside phosphotransferase (APT) family kinase protein
MREVERALTNMTATVRDQLNDALVSFHERDPASADQVVERDDIVDNLNGALEERIFEAIGAAGANISEGRRWRAALRVLSNLERIGDAATHIAKHSIMMSHEPDPVIEFPLDDLATIAVQGFTEGVEGFVKQDLDLAKSACERERELDELYVKKLHQLMALLDKGEGHARYLLHVLAAMKYLEKTADFALNIGEAAFFAVTGTRLKYPQFKQLETLLAEADRSSSNVVYRHFWDGISGAIVLEIDSPDGQRFLFKEGMRKKMDQEIDRVIEWENLAPLRTPRLIGKAQDKDRRAVLREFAEGALLQDILLSPENDEGKFAAMHALLEALLDIWGSTLIARPPRIDYSQQIRSRMREILRRHPDLEDVAKEELSKYGGMFGTLDVLQRKEASLAPPFSVWIHGDLNANNAVYDAASRQVVFIDVHRSRYGDYAGDVGVLLTSTFRQFPRKKIARIIELVNDSMVETIAEFAQKNHDTHFEDRLKLARARALVTSARLTDDADRAEALFVEGLKFLKRGMRALKL